MDAHTTNSWATQPTKYRGSVIGIDAPAEEMLFETHFSLKIDLIDLGREC